jgi:hypothetical protein
MNYNSMAIVTRSCAEAETSLLEFRRKPARFGLWSPCLSVGVNIFDAVALNVLSHMLAGTDGDLKISSDVAATNYHHRARFVRVGTAVAAIEPFNHDNILNFRGTTCASCWKRVLFRAAAPATCQPCIHTFVPVYLSQCTREAAVKAPRIRHFLHMYDLSSAHALVQACT